MSKYIDLSVKTDIQVDAIKQSTLKIGSESVAIIPTSEADSTLQYESGSWKYTNHGVSKELSKTLLPSTNRISFTGADLVNGKLTIKHNLGFKYILGLDYTVMPKNITFVDENTLELDYSDQPNTITGSIWFVMSDQTMLVQLAKTVKNNLVAYWSLDEGADSAIVQDSMGNYPLITEADNQLYLHGGYLGVIGSAWGSMANNFQCVRSTEKISSDVYKNAYTFNIWFLFPYISTSGNRQLIGINKSADSTNYMKEIGLYVSSDGWLHFCPVYWSGTQGSWDGFVSTQYTLGAWGMATGVFENGLAKLYLNGTLAGTKTFESLPDSTGYLALFCQSWNQRNPLRLDEAGFWTRALNESEIAFLYNNGKGFNPVSSVQGDGTASIFPVDDLLVCVPLDCPYASWVKEGEWEYLSESFSGNTFGLQDGIPCIYKTDSYGAYTLSPASRLPTGETPFTVSYWAKSSTEGNPMAAETLNITFGESDGYDTFRMGLSATGVAVQNLDHSTAHADIYYDIDGTTWHHVLFRYTETAGELWADGVKCGETTERYTIKPEKCMIFGRHYYNHGVGFTGAMSSLRIYGRALSESEIQALAKEFTPTT